MSESRPMEQFGHVTERLMKETEHLVPAIEAGMPPRIEFDTKADCVGEGRIKVTRDGAHRPVTYYSLPVDVVREFADRYEVTAIGHEEAKRFFDEWPGGLDEIESCVKGWNQRHAEMEAKLRVVVEALDWYAEKAEAMQRLLEKQKSHAVLAVCTELSQDAGRRAISAKAIAVTERYRHHKGGTYVKICEAKMESDQTLVVIYRSEQDDQIWARPAAEFADRFTPVASGSD